MSSDRRRTVRGASRVLQHLRAVQCWPLWVRLALMWVGLGAAYLLQIPAERDWPGEPFLLFLLVVIGTTLCFGTRLGLISAALSAFLSLYFFEPVGSPTLRYASDFNKIALYAIIAFGSVAVFAHSVDTPTDNNKSISLRELMHRIANNFDAIATLIKTKLILGDAIEQVRIVRRRHAPAEADTAAPNLGEVNALWRDVIHVIPAAVYMTDEKGRITFYNEAAAAFWGCRPELGDSKFCGSWKLYWPDGTPLPHDECPMALALRQRRPIRGMEAVAERPDGTRIPFAPYPIPLFDATGRLTGAVNMLVDVSERMRAEQDKQQLAAIVDSSGDAIIGKDLSGIIKSWNPGAERLFGYARGETIGKSITLVIPPHLWDEEASILDRLARGERIEHFETIRVRKDGTLVNVSLSISPVRNGRSGVVGVSTIARDITERKRAEQVLVERNIVLALAGRAAHVGSFAYDIDTEIMEISDDYAAIHGFPVGTAKLARSECLTTVHPEDMEQVELARSGAFRERRSEYNAEYRIIRPGGAVRWVEIRCFISYDGNGYPKRVVGVSIDATDRKQAELRLAERNTQLELASKTARVGSFAIDFSTGVVHLSPGCATIFGLPESIREMSRDDARKLVHPEDLAQRLDGLRDQAFLNQQREFITQFRIIRANDGEVRWIEVRSLILYDESGRPLRLIAVIIDFTERKLAEQALAERNAQLALAGRAALVGSYVYDVKRGTMQISQGYATIHGLPEATTETTIGEWRARVHPEDLARAEGLREQAFADRRNEDNAEYRIVLSSGEVRWIERRGTISYEQMGRPERVVGVNIDVTERKRAEERQRLLIAELDHRVKNALATVSAVVSQTAVGSRSMTDFVAALDGRIRSMATTHELLSSGRWQGISLIELVRRELAPYATPYNAKISGPEVLLRPEAGQAMALVLHELATNAAKYGALSTKEGTVAVRWDRWLSGHPSRLVLEWQEIGGPRIVAAGNSSYGTSTIRDLIPFEFGGTVELSLAPEGVRCRVELPGEWLSSGGESASEARENVSLRIENA
jgi:PAS domain S-box-containing protein